MKKIYVLAGALLALSGLQAQTTVDFEDLTLPKVDTFYNGSDFAGEFISAGVTFNVNFDVTYNFWGGGFAYSNMRDDTTAGFTNLFSAYPASGANGSENYGVNTQGDTLFFPSPSNLIGVALANTTYANLSMKNGDFVGKVFGSTTDANGDADGTQGKDYFYITIYGFDATDNVVDSLDFYFADFTSSNPADHYILDTWKEQDLSVFQNVSYLTFKYTSSDVGDYGINTPTFFALDNLVYTESTTDLQNEELVSFNVYPNPTRNTLNVNGAKGIYAIFNLNGEKAMQFSNVGTTSIDVSQLKSGMYFIKNIETPSIAQKLILQ